MTHIYKFQGKTDKKIKICNVIPKQRHIKIGKHEKNSYVIVKEDIIDEDWLHDLVVVKNGCKEWWYHIKNEKTCNIIYSLPVASIADRPTLKPLKDKNAPVLMFPQGTIGTCGISAFSSAFTFYFDRYLGAQIYMEKDKYLEELSAPITNKSKKSSALKFLIYFDPFKNQHEI